MTPQEQIEKLREALRLALGDLEGYRRNCRCEGGGDIPSDGESAIRSTLTTATPPEGELVVVPFATAQHPLDAWSSNAATFNRLMAERDEAQAEVARLTRKNARLNELVKISYVSAKEHDDAMRAAESRILAAKRKAYDDAAKIVESHGECWTGSRDLYIQEREAAAEETVVEVAAAIRQRAASLTENDHLRDVTKMEI
jgi:hypothetical protein